MAEPPAPGPWTLPQARWPWQRSLQRRILFTYGAVFAAVILVLMAAVGRVVYQAAVEEAHHALEVEAFLAANALEDPNSGYLAEFEAFDRWEDEHSGDDDDKQDHKPEDGSNEQPAQRLQLLAQIFAGDSGSRVAILDPQGAVVADSVYAFGQAPNQLAEPEVRAALQGIEPRSRRIDPLTDEETLFVAAPIQVGDRVLGIVQISRPVEQVAAAIHPLLASLAAAGLAALAMAVLAGIGLSRRLTRPVRRLEDAALAMAGGDLEQQVPVETPDELGELAIAFNFMVREVRATLAQQRAFVANASHELRTPITNIKLRSEALLGGAAGDALVRDRYLADIDREADRLGRLAGALLDLSRLDENGADRAAVQPTPSLPLLRQVIEGIAPRAQQAGQALVANLPEDLPAVLAPAEDLEAIVVNLLDNALKYTPAGGVVKIDALAIGDTLRLCIEDNGPGIPAEDLDHIFDRFYRVDKARSRQTHQTGERAGSGAGLGLSIVRSLVEIYGGSIQVASIFGRGASFTVLLPAAPSPGAP